ncbi:hypothetical protein LOK49_LG10G01258 [Camellia lanceoleosa]|uniref:Uncharacterized protein n=1 Tax=Camellia lanceoleosa TaxID=1840588 RepID=A0ACC0G5J0_9ERIC|nr:hypothetical protein LOK49_LG10G01258 [Camellia lanceoleosa]
MVSPSQKLAAGQAAYGQQPQQSTGAQRGYVQPRYPQSQPLPAAQVAPYNTFYSQLEVHIDQVGIEATINRWDDPVALGVVDPHDSLSYPAGVSDVQAESATCLDSDQFTNFVIPNWFEGESSGSTKANPFPLPDVYMLSQRRNILNWFEGESSVFVY